MATNLADLKKNRAALFSKVSKELEQKSSSKDVDVRFWKLERDKTGNAQAIIRFLPPVNEGDELPWVRIFSHAFKGPTGKWYINNSLTTIGQPDPLSEHNRALWDAGSEEQKAQVRVQKRKTHFVSNILVIKDPAHPENDGKVFLYKYGKKIHDMITSKAKPEFEDEAPVFVYDLWEGANFRLKIKSLDGYPNYDSSVFDTSTELYSGNEEKVQKVLDSTHRLADFHNADQFKSYEALKKELDRALGLDGGSAPRPAIEDMGDEEERPAPVKVAVKKTESAPSKPKVEGATMKVAPPAEEEDDMSFFKDLLND